MPSRSRSELIADLSFGATLAILLFGTCALHHLPQEPALSLPAHLLEVLVLGPLSVFDQLYTPPRGFAFLCAAPTFWVAMGALALHLAHDFGAKARWLIWPLLVARHALFALLMGGAMAYLSDFGAVVLTGIPLLFFGVVAWIVESFEDVRARLPDVLVALLALEWLLWPAVVTLWLGVM